MNLEQKLLNIDFSNKETKETLKSFFKGDIFKDEEGSNFVSFLENLQGKIERGHPETFKLMLCIRKKIKKGKLLTQVEINRAQDLFLHHWKGSNVQRRTFDSMYDVDFRDAKADFTTIQGDLSHSVWGNLRGQKIEGNNDNQRIDGDNKDQVIKGDNNEQEIVGNNCNQIIKGDNVDQEIRRDNDSQTIEGDNLNQIIKGDNNIQNIIGANYGQIIRGDNYKQVILSDNTSQEIGGNNEEQDIGCTDLEENMKN